ncbi:hypothetical protein T07_11120 [Trichinella nelsoni]|uniref:Uncharacterized protein n=1 Tax=Trichinella nelsoni TaxID=6336 RepID=A0A0V0RYH8_9BILA|nr:hypothetical protein T07_11120 [Trichinella nelsoni]
MNNECSVEGSDLSGGKLNNADGSGNDLTFSLGPFAYNGRDLLTSDLSGALSTGSVGEQYFDIGLIVQMTNGHLTQRLLILGDTNASNKSLYSVHSPCVRGYPVS